MSDQGKNCDLFAFLIKFYYNSRYVVLNALIDNNPIILANYYAPCEEPDQLKILDELIVFSVSCKLKRILSLYGVVILM